MRVSLTLPCCPLQFMWLCKNSDAPRSRKIKTRALECQDESIACYLHSQLPVPFPHPPIHTGVTGFPSPSPATSFNLSSTSNPVFNTPNATYLPFNFASCVSLSVSTIKNWEEFVFLPELAIARVPFRILIFNPSFSSLNLPPYIDCGR